MIWLSILTSHCYTFPCKLVARIWYYTKITTSTWYIWVFSLPVCWIVDGYCWEKLHGNHFWEFKGWTKQFLEMQSIITNMPTFSTWLSCQYNYYSIQTMMQHEYQQIFVHLKVHFLQVDLRYTQKAFNIWHMVIYVP